jgi:hypothetical protein
VVCDTLVGMSKKPTPKVSAVERQLLGRIDAVKRIFKKRHIYAGELLPSAQQAALSDLDFALMKTIRAFNEEHPGFNPSKELKAKAAGAS